MENKTIEARIEECLKLLGDIKAKVGDERTALAILQEVKRDIRGERAGEDRKNGNGYSASKQSGEYIPATGSQVNYLKKLGVEVPKALTKEAASELIDEAKANKGESNSDSLLQTMAPISFPQYRSQVGIWADPIGDLADTYWADRDLYGF